MAEHVWLLHCGCGVAAASASVSSAGASTGVGLQEKILPFAMQRRVTAPHPLEQGGTGLLACATGVDTATASSMMASISRAPEVLLLKKPLMMSLSHLH